MESPSNVVVTANIVEDTAINMKKEEIIQKLREQGCRITKQRLIILDIILEEECFCCKEIYYKASKLNSGIGIATVYRTVSSLEAIGAISRRSIYKIEDESCKNDGACTIELDDDTSMQLSRNTLNCVLLAGMKVCGYVQEQKIKNVIMSSCNWT